jgi:hypothetical protein
MDESAIREGQPVVVTSTRVIAGRSWRGRRGVVWGTFHRARQPDWAYIKFASDDEQATVAFYPHEIEAAR